MEKYKWKFIKFLWLFVLSSCYSISEKPDVLLSKDEMKTVLTEIYLYKNYPIAIDSFLPINNYEIKTAVLKKHKIQETVFDESLHYYTLRPKKYKNILLEIEQEIQKKKEIQENTIK